MCEISKLAVSHKFFMKRCEKQPTYVCTLLAARSYN